MRFINGVKSSSARYRVRLERIGPASGMTHLAQIESLRRAVASSGISFVPDGKRSRPRPKLAFGPAISVGHESFAEYFDMETTTVYPPAQIAGDIGGRLDDGFSVREVRKIPPFFPSLEASINVVAYEIRGSFPSGSQRSIDEFLGRTDIFIDKKKDGGRRVERIDAKPLILRMRMSSEQCLDLTLRFGPKRTLKPEAIVREWLGLIPVQQNKDQGQSAALQGFVILRKELLSETSGGQLLTP